MAAVCHLYTKGERLFLSFLLQILAQTKETEMKEEEEEEEEESFTSIWGIFWK